MAYLRPCPAKRKPGIYFGGFLRYSKSKSPTQETTTNMTPEGKIRDFFTSFSLPLTWNVKLDEIVAAIHSARIVILLGISSSTCIPGAVATLAEGKNIRLNLEKKILQLSVHPLFDRSINQSIINQSLYQSAVKSQANTGQGYRRLGVGR